MLQRFTEQFRQFFRGLATNWLGTAGVVLTTSAFLLFLFMELMRVLGIVTNAYVGLITYLALPALFVLGLVLIPFAWRLYRRQTGHTTRELLSSRFTSELLEPKRTGARLFGIIGLLTVVNLLFLSVGGARMLHFMDTPVFCGTACHRVMNPEWTTYQVSPHSRVHCVECHVGEGVDALIDSKLNGLWQIISATFHLYEQPIPTPVRNLRPARETCEQCHWPDKFYGDRIRIITRYGLDSLTTPTYTTLSQKIGSGSGQKRGEIHWHIAAENEVRYASIGDAREEMVWVDVRQPDGSYLRFRNQGLTSPGSVPIEEVRVLDCVDCHNRATHIYEDPERAVDVRIEAGELDRRLPHIKQVALRALTIGYPDEEAAMAGIETELQSTYGRIYREAAVGLQGSVDDAVEVLQEIYRRNIHHGMRITWNAYPSHLGHDAGGGCFRCHNSDLVDETGSAISSDCTLCHSILAYESPGPFHFLLPPDDNDPERKMHRFLREEFLGSERPDPPVPELF